MRLIPEPRRMRGAMLAAGFALVAAGFVTASYGGVISGTIVLAFVIVPPILTLRYRAREVSVDGDVIHWKPYLGRRRVLPVSEIAAFEGVKPPLQVRVIGTRGHRSMVIAEPMPRTAELAQLLVAARPSAPLLRPPPLSLSFMRHYWDAFEVRPIDDTWRYGGGRSGQGTPRKRVTPKT